MAYVLESTPHDLLISNVSVAQALKPTFNHKFSVLAESYTTMPVSLSPTP